MCGQWVRSVVIVVLTRNVSVVQDSYALLIDDYMLVHRYLKREGAVGTGQDDKWY